MEDVFNYLECGHRIRDVVGEPVRLGDANQVRYGSTFRPRKRPRYIKLSFRSKEAAREILRRSVRLKNNYYFSNIFIKRDMRREERLAEYAKRKRNAWGDVTQGVHANNRAEQSGINYQSEHAAEAGDRDEMSEARRVNNSDNIEMEGNEEDGRSGIRIEEDMSRERGENEWGDRVGEETDQDEGMLFEGSQIYSIRSQIMGEEESVHDEGSKRDGEGSESDELEDILIEGSQEYLITSQTVVEEEPFSEEGNISRLEPAEGRENRVANETEREDSDTNSGNGAEQGETAKG